MTMLPKTRVIYRTTSGFCDQLYRGTIIRVGKLRSMVRLDHYGVIWIDNIYLQTE